MTKEQVLALNLTEEQRERAQAVYNAFEKFHDKDGKKKGTGKVEKPAFEDLKTEDEVKEHLNKLIENYKKRKDKNPSRVFIRSNVKQAIIGSCNDFLADYSEFGATDTEIYQRFIKSLGEYAEEFIKQKIEEKELEIAKLKKKLEK